MASKIHMADTQAEYYLSLERSLSRRNRRANLILLVLGGALLLVMGLLLCLLPQKDFSPEENRSLAAAPKISMQTMMDGSLSTGIADFCADQFPLRSLFISAKAGVELLLGKMGNNDVLLGKDGYLITRQEYDEAQRTILYQNMAAVDRFATALKAQNIPFTFAVVPRSIDVNRNKLPPLYNTVNADAASVHLDQSAKQKNLPWINLTDILQRAAATGDAVWYKTDHHWTMQGAYLAYVDLSEALGYTPYPADAFSQQVVCENFLGTTHASSGMRWIKGENIILWRYEDDETFTTEIIEGGKTIRALNGFYDLAALETHDEYNVFLGGTNTLIRITCPTRENAPSLILLKDSFSQSLAPYLARHFDLLLIDMRSYDIRSSGSLSALIEHEQADHVLLLYGIDTLYDSYSLKNLTFGLN
jgi:hypothetical protein